MPLGLGTRLRAFGFQTPVLSVGLQLPRLDAIMQETWQHLVDNLIAQRWVLDRERQFDPPEEISRHPICAGKEDSGLTGILKIKDPAVFEKTANDADNTDILAQPRHFWSQTTDAADDQIDGDFRTRSLVQLLNDLLIDERVQFRDDTRWFARPTVVAFPLNQLDKPAMHIKRRDHQFLESRITCQASESVEDSRYFLRQLGFAGEQTKVGVNARSARVIVARA